MNKRHLLFGALLALATIGCWETVELEPLSFPQLLRNEVQIVQAFDNDLFFVGGNQGYFVNYPDQSEVTHKNNSTNDFGSYNEETMEFLVDQNNVIYGVNGEYLLKITSSGYSYSDAFLTGATSLRSFAISPDNELVMADYWETESQGGNFFYKIRLSTWRNGRWDDVETEMTVSDTHLGTPEIVFTEEGDLIILTNPIYRVPDYNDGADFEKFIPNTQPGIAAKSINSAHIDGSSVFGFDRALSEQVTVSQAYSFNLNSGIWSATLLEDGNGCELDDIPFQLTKVLGTEGTVTYAWVPAINNSFSETPGLIGYVVKYDHSRDNCGLIEVADPDAFSSGRTIYDVAYLKTANEVLVATSDGLYSYDVATSEAELYLFKAFNPTNE